MPRSAKAAASQRAAGTSEIATVPPRMKSLPEGIGLGRTRQPDSHADDCDRRFRAQTQVIDARLQALDELRQLARGSRPRRSASGSAAALLIPSSAASLLQNPQ